MDSGSGSMQSSSGGDEEYDSHQQPDHPLIPPSSFLNNIIPQSHIVSSGSLPRPLFHLPHTFQTLQPNFFDFSSTYNLNPDSSFTNLDVVRPTATLTRSEPINPINPSAAGPSPHGSNQTTQPPFRPGPSSSAQLRPPVHDNNDPRSSVLHPKSTKKRTRASRRAPTTVLTTDTSNFRAMVQEFTGIPAPPFAGTGSSYSRRFDLFGSSSSALRTTTTHLEPPGSALYPLRPKVQLFSPPTVPPLLNNHSVMVESAASTSYQLPPSDDHHLGLTKEPQTTSNMQQTTVPPFQLLSGSHIDQHHIHGSSQLLSALQSDESWRENGAAGRANNCKLNFSGS